MKPFSHSMGRRLAAVAMLLGLGYALLQYRLYHLQILRHQELLGKAERYLNTMRVLDPWRGEIRSRDGDALAMDVPVKEVWANLTLTGNRPEAVASVLGPLLGRPPDELAKVLRPALVGFRSDGQPVYQEALRLQRDLHPWEWERIEATLTNATFGLDAQSPKRQERRLLDRLRRKAIFARDSHQRYYPLGDSLASVLGFLGATRDRLDVCGQAGLERSLQTILGGTPGSFWSDKTAGGIELPWRRRSYRSPEDGNHVVLTIDSALQRIVEDALDQVVTAHTPSNAAILVVRPRTGEILAWATYPRFDPQQPGASPPFAWRNRPIHDMVEPGSTFKPFTLAAALNEGLATLEEEVFCEQGAWTYRAPIRGRPTYRRITLHDYKPFGRLTVAEVLAKSSNIGMAKLALRLGPDRLYDYLVRFGFGRPTGVPLHGEAPGGMSTPTNWVYGPLLYIPMGQGIAVTQLQMTMAYAALGNDGLLMRPLLVDRVESPLGEVLAQARPQPVHYVVHPQTARLVRQAMAQVVSRQGTGAAAMSDVHILSGKTGTAEKANRHGYVPGLYYASFIGFLPADSPELCISVAVDEPRNGHQGGRAAAPAFRQVAEAAAALYRIPPELPWTTSLESLAGGRLAEARPHPDLDYRE